jgi:hypothetical protein
MLPVFFNRNFSGKFPLPPNLKGRVSRYSWNMIGGPWDATILADAT